MECKHERIKSVNCKLFCMDCGAEMPTEALLNPQAGKNPTTEAKPAEPTKTPVKRNSKRKEGAK